MMKFSIPFLAATLAFPALLPATEARVDLNGIKEGIQFTKTAGDGVNLYKATWVKPEEQSQRVFLQKNSPATTRRSHSPSPPTRAEPSGSPLAGTGWKKPKSGRSSCSTTSPSTEKRFPTADSRKLSRATGARGRTSPLRPTPTPVPPPSGSTTTIRFPCRSK